MYSGRRQHRFSLGRLLQNAESSALRFRLRFSISYRSVGMYHTRTKGPDPRDSRLILPSFSVSWFLKMILMPLFDSGLKTQSLITLVISKSVREFSWEIRNREWRTWEHSQWSVSCDSCSGTFRHISRADPGMVMEEKDSGLKRSSARSIWLSPFNCSVLNVRVLTSAIHPFFVLASKKVQVYMVHDNGFQPSQVV